MKGMEKSEKEALEQLLAAKKKLEKIKHKLAILSGKGGVGKSTFTANLAVALANKKFKVGILDADIHGPSIPKILNTRGKTLKTRGEGGDVIPVEGLSGIRVVSMDLLLPGETPIIWRGPLKAVAIRQFLAYVDWGDLDFLLVDLPPGTGDEPLSIIQLIQKIDGLLMITAPSEVSQMVVKRAIGFARQLQVPLVGVVENMSGFVCPECGAKTYIFGSGGGRKISGEMGVDFLGEIPIDQKVAHDSDRGTPFITKHPDTPAARAFMEVVKEIENFLNQKVA